MEKQIIILFGVIILNILFINFVSAERLVSENGVEYDTKILDMFSNSTYVDVTIRLDDSINRDNFITEFSDEEFKGKIITWLQREFCTLWNLFAYSLTYDE